MDEAMKIYLDNCCFNRPFDDQSQLRIRLEAEAKLQIQEDVRSGTYELVWSYILDYENNKNPFRERRERIATWRSYSKIDVEEDAEIIQIATNIMSHRIKQMDAMHIACAIKANTDYFLTTDDGLIKKATQIQRIHIIDPIDFIREIAI